MRKPFTSAAIVVTLACGHAQAGDTEDKQKMGFVVAVGSLGIAKCIAPVTDPSRLEDFNFLSDALWSIGDLSRFVPEAVVDQQKEKAIKFLDDVGEASFCERVKKSLDSLVEDSRRKYMDSLIAARKSWGKLK